MGVEGAEEGSLVDSLLGCERSKGTLQMHQGILLGTFFLHIFLTDAKLESWGILPFEQSSRVHFPEHCQIFWMQ